MKTTTHRTALFGPYTLDLHTGELRKFGTKVKMGEQTFQILRALLETPGELVTREELRAKVWAGDTFVDFDHGLNSAVQRLRDCLSDSAENPRCVETIPRRGYRFVGRVEWSDDAPPSEMLADDVAMPSEPVVCVSDAVPLLLNVPSAVDGAVKVTGAPPNGEPFELTKTENVPNGFPTGCGVMYPPD